MDLFDIAMIGALLVALGVAVLVIAWPMADAREVMPGVHGDEPGLPQ